MKILTPLCPDTHLDDLIPFREDVELYAGFMDADWENKFGSGYGLNRMSSFSGGANYASFRQLLDVISQVTDIGIPVHVTCNALSYDLEQIEFFRQRYLLPLREIDNVGIITSSTEMIKCGRELGFFVSVSTISGVYNAAAARFYQDTGASSVILPRELTSEEIASIIQKTPGLEFEAFLMNSGCRFSDSVCMGCHIPRQGGLCQMLDQSKGELHGLMTRDVLQCQQMSSLIYHNLFMRDACGLCALYRLLKLGIRRGKIVGRSAGSRVILNTLEWVLRNLDIAENCVDEESYLSKMQVPPGADWRCAGGFSCYYPEVIFPVNTLRKRCAS